MKATQVSNATILLVDDNKDGLVVRRSLLEELGYHVEISARTRADPASAPLGPRRFLWGGAVKEPLDRTYQVHRLMGALHDDRVGSGILFIEAHRFHER